MLDDFAQKRLESWVGFIKKEKLINWSETFESLVTEIKPIKFVFYLLVILRETSGKNGSDWMNERIENPFRTF